MCHTRDLFHQNFDFDQNKDSFCELLRVHEAFGRKKKSYDLDLSQMDNLPIM